MKNGHLLIGVGYSRVWDLLPRLFLLQFGVKDRRWLSLNRVIEQKTSGGVVIMNWELVGSPQVWILQDFLLLQITAARAGLFSKLPDCIFCHPWACMLSILFRNLMGCPLSLPLGHPLFYFVLWWSPGSQGNQGHHNKEAIRGTRGRGKLCSSSYIEV